MRNIFLIYLICLIFLTNYFQFPPQIVSYFSLFNPEPKSVISSVPDTMPPVSSNTPTPFSSYDCNPNHSPRSPSPVSPYHSLIIDTFIRESSMNTKTPSYLKDYVCNALQLTISVPFVSLVLSFSFTNVSPTDQVCSTMSLIFMNLLAMNRQCLILLGKTPRDKN